MAGKVDRLIGLLTSTSPHRMRFLGYEAVMFLRAMMLFFLATAAPVAHARKMPAISWAKPGVSFDEYRSDAVECAKRGYFRDISGDEPAKRYIRGVRSAQDDLNQGDIGGANIDGWIDAMQRTQPDRREREVHALQVGDVEQCLTAKGYKQFTLTKPELKQLARYPTGSIERHTYLHRLAAR